MLRSLTTLAIAALCLATPGVAAKLAVAEGEVLVNQGKGFKPGVAGQELRPGDRVMVRKKGSEAVIDHEDACSERLRMDERGQSSNRVVVVGRISPCASGAPTVPGALLPTDIGLIAGAAGAAAIGAVILWGRGGDNPASP